MKRIVNIAVASTGCAAIVSQIVLVRELLIVYYGNELSMAFVLAGWLSAGAIGSALLGRLTKRAGDRASLFSALLAIQAVLLPLTLWSIRSIKGVLGLNPGEIVPFFPMIMTSFAVLAPICMLTGFLFALACAIMGDDGREHGQAVGKVYALESFGAMAGGAAASLFLVRYLGSVETIAVVSVLLVVMATLVSFSSIGRGGRLRAIILGAALGLLALHLVASLSGAWQRFERETLGRQWRGYTILGARSSIYGDIVVTAEGSQYSFFSNGLHLYTIPDRQFCEESVHFALLEHPDPKRVLIIGGGVAGLVAEALKHPVDRVDYVELDPLIIRMAAEFLPRSWVSPLEDRRVNVRYDDGRRYVAGVADEYDVIIIALGDPYTAQLNRFYTAEFFGAARRAMREGGVISFALTASESYLSREARAFLGSIRATLASVFADVAVVPGESVTFLATAHDGVLTHGYRAMIERAERRRLDLMYVRDYYLASRLSKEKIDALERSVRSAAPSINRDFAPISYYYDMVFWAARFKGSYFARILHSIRPSGVLAFVVTLALSVLAIGMGAARKARAGSSALVSVAVNGFSQIVLQITTLLSFQIIYGYMYYKLGVVITACMAGLASGGLIGARLASRGGAAAALAMRAQIALASIALAMPSIFIWTRGLERGILSWAGANIVFTVVPLLSGICGGLLFSAAGSYRLKEGEEAGVGGGLAYGFDLIGSCAGALLAGTILIPLVGISKTCYAVAALNGAAAVVLAVAHRQNITEVAR